MFLDGAFLEKRPTLTVGSFLYPRTVRVFVYLFNLNYTCPNHTLDTLEPRPKQNRRPEPRKYTKEPRFGYLGVFT